MTSKTYDFEKYQYGALAANLAQSNEGEFASGALEVLAGAKGLNLGEEALGFIRGTQASEDGIKTAIADYSKSFQDKRSEYKPADLADWYDSVLKGLKKEDKKKYLSALGKHDETIKTIRKKVKIASRIVKAQEDDDIKGEYTPEQVSKAKETMDEYRNIFSVMAALDQYKFEELRPVAVEAARKRDLEALAKKL